MVNHIFQPGRVRIRYDRHDHFNSHIDHLSVTLTKISLKDLSEILKLIEIQNEKYPHLSINQGSFTVMKKAIVVGASSGIGHATALKLADQGWDVIVHGFRKLAQTHELAGLIQKKGRRSHVLIADLRDQLAVHDLVEQAWNLWGGLDAWLQLAGADILTGDARHFQFDEKLQMLWSVDVASTISACRLVGQYMRAQGHGSILTMGWDQAETGMDGDSGELFAATKAAVMAFSKSLSLSLSPTVRVNCVAPGWIKTEWGNTAPENWQQRVLRETPLNRWGLPEDIANACAYLVSEESRFVTGQILRVNGGAIR